MTAAHVRNVPPTLCLWAPFLCSLSRHRELNSPLAPRRSEGTFPRIVSNRELLKTRPDFTGHILEMKAVTRPAGMPPRCHSQRPSLPGSRTGGEEQNCGLPRGNGKKII